MWQPWIWLLRNFFDGSFLLMSLLSLPVFKFKYESDRVINWKEVRSVVFSSHYIFMFVLMFYFGLCVAFQAFWEFWYLDGLGVGPLALGMTSLIRRSMHVVSI